MTVQDIWSQNRSMAIKQGVLTTTEEYINGKP